MWQSKFRFCPVKFKFDINHPKCIILSIIIALVLIGSNLVAVTPSVLAQTQTNAGSCVRYDAHQKMIHISCASIHLSDIYQQLNNASILQIENSTGSNKGTQNGKVWILNAGITIEKYGGLVIDSTDTSWLKIVPIATIQQKGQPGGLVGIEKDTGTNDEDDEQGDDTISNAVTGTYQYNSNNSYTKGKKPVIVSRNNGDNPNGIHVFGSLRIDSVKITSWNPEKNQVITFDPGKRLGEENTKSKYDTIEPRAFIRVSNEATGTTNITNSEIAYLGYSCSRCAGISYYGGMGSIIKGNNIHHLLKGFYSKAMGAMIVENNTIHDNYLYGIDPHTGTHDMIIRNNTVYRNNASAVICSKHCYNILFEGNEVYNNRGVAHGVFFSINTTHSIARNNYVHDQVSCIGSNRDSNFNTIVDNHFSNCKTAVNLADTVNNVVINNKIVGAQVGIVFRNIENSIFDNSVQNSTNGFVIEVLNSSARNQTIIDKDNEIDQGTNTAFLNNLTSVNQMSGVKNPTVITVIPTATERKLQQLE